MHLSLRLRLTLWYGLLLALTLIGVAVVSYVSIQNELQKNLDASLESVASSIDQLIKQKQQELRQPFKLSKRRTKRKKRGEKEDGFAFLRQEQQERPDSLAVSDSIPAAEERDVVWVAVYQHVLLNSKNYYIQIAGLDDTIIWRSENLEQDTLPLVFDVASLQKVEAPIAKFSHCQISGKPLRMVSRVSALSQVTAAYPEEEIEATLSQLFSVSMMALPAVLLFSMSGGWLLARYSLNPVDKIIDAARDITAHNLSSRLPIPVANDEIARLTETLNDMFERLEDSFSQIRQFTSDVSHELRTPLAILTGELELALRSPKSARQYTDTLSSSLEEVSRLSKVVQSLLDLSRGESGQVVIDVENVELSKLVYDVCEDMQLLAEDKGVRLDMIIEPDICIEGDSVRLHQVLLNIIDNAVKYTPPNGSILVRFQMEKDRVAVRVSDSGVGIPSESLEHVFDRFYRVDKSRSRDVEGTGLGLSIAKWIVEAHHGDIFVDSVEGKGSIFTIILPLSQTESSI